MMKFFGNNNKHILKSHRFRSVHGSAVMSDVLGGVKHSEGQASQEVTR